MAKKLKTERIEDELLKLLTLVDMNHVLTVNQNGIVCIGGEKADGQTLKNLKSEAEYILSTNVWKVIYESPKELAHRAMFAYGEGVDDLKKGRSMLYTLESQKRILETLAAYKEKPNIPNLGK